MTFNNLPASKIEVSKKCHGHYSLVIQTRTKNCVKSLAHYTINGNITLSIKVVRRPEVVVLHNHSQIKYYKVIMPDNSFTQKNAKSNIHQNTAAMAERPLYAQYVHAIHNIVSPPLYSQYNFHCIADLQNRFFTNI